jgi:hypothetical protein
MPRERVTLSGLLEELRPGDLVGIYSLEGDLAEYLQVAESGEDGVRLGWLGKDEFIKHVTGILERSMDVVIGVSRGESLAGFYLFSLRRNRDGASFLVGRRFTDEEVEAILRVSNT